LPGAILPVEIGAQRLPCLVKHGFPDNSIEPSRNITLEVGDCTEFKVCHRGRGDTKISPETADDLLEDALQAINEVIVWFRAQKEEMANQNAFLRQVGRSDVRYFLAISPDDEVVVLGSNPAFQFERSNLAAMASFPFNGNMIVTNGPAGRPLHPVVRRAVGSLTLINIGFYAEAFITMFALADDQIQSLLHVGFAKKGLSKKQRDKKLVVDQSRLERFLTILLEESGWQSLQASHASLYQRVMAANTLRNTIMHGKSTIFTKAEAMVQVHVLLDLLEWLAANPFGYRIPPINRDNIAILQFRTVEKALTQG